MTDSHSVSPMAAFCSVWASSFAECLAALKVSSPTATPGDSSLAASFSPEELENIISVRFSGGGSLKGELMWLAEKPVALQLAQLFQSSPSNPAADFADAHRDAYSELLRQVADKVAAAWKKMVGAETELAFHSATKPAFAPSNAVVFRLAGEKLPALSLRLLLDENLGNALAAAPPAPQEQIPAQESQSFDSPPPHPQPPSEAPPAAAEAVSLPAPPIADSPAPPVDPPLPPASPAEFVPPPIPRTGPIPANLDLLLDVELEATIRFGEREMLLRDIFGLMPGAIVELQQMVNDPAELFVAGRLVARGEVVVVDGNFGLRVTEVASSGQRAALLQI